ncbi:hypothetical protein SOVF_015010 [Spinacia oleracea]|nr:hypothetical protein SOVF_015010 [Spinacia oleracea]
MGCGPSKAEDLPLVTFCRARKDLIKSASDHRFALAAAHFAYFRQLRDVGDSLFRFVEEELILTSSSSSPSSLSSLSSPVLTLPSDDNPKKKNKGFKSHKKGKNGSSFSTSISHNLRGVDAMEGDHLHLSDDDEEDEEMGSSFGDHHHRHSHSHSGHLDIDDEDEDEEDERREKVKKKKKKGGGGGGRRGAESSPPPPPTPRPGISYIPDSEFPGVASNYPYPFDQSYANNSNNTSNYSNNNHHPYYQPAPNVNNNGIPPYYYSNPSSSSYYPDNGYSTNYDYNGGNYNYNNNGATTSYTTYYMKKSSTRIPSVIYEEPRQNPVYAFSDYNGQPSYSNYSNFGVSGMSSENRGSNVPPPQQPRRPPTPPSPKVSAWDYFNPFETLEGGGAYSGYFGQNPSFGLESNSSSPDSREVREREGIPELEEETESEVSKEPYHYDNKKKVQEEFSFPKNKNKTVQFEDGNGNGNGNGNGKGKNRKSSGNLDEGNSIGVRARERVPLQHPQREEPPPEPPVEVEKESDVKGRSSISISSPETESNFSISIEDVSVKKRGVSFEVGGGDGGGGGGSSRDIESSKLSSSTMLSTNGTRDLREVVREIKDEFVAATDYGEEVSVLLEVGKEPYKSRSSLLKVILARVCSTSLSSSYSPSSLPGGYPRNAGEDFDSRSLASTLEKLYAWEKKLYKEVKDEERLRVMYEKQCKKLKTLDDQGAEISKIEATQASIRKLLTRINVSVRAVDYVSRRIHKLRDEELLPQMKELIFGLRKMWKLMFKCHQKQFQAILESKTRALKANTGLRKDSSVRATIHLEAQLLKWCHRFNNWVDMQRSYAETLNGWLEKCIQYEPEITPDGVVPFSPGRIGAPPVFVICHDWKQAMERVSGSEVQTAMNDFATSLHQLWERQDEEQRRRVKAENMYTDFEKQIRAIRRGGRGGGGGHEHDHDDATSDKNSLSMVSSGISPLDDLKVDLDSMRQRVREERAGHKEAVKLVHDAVSRSIQAGLIPIFESLESFTSETSQAFDDVRLEHDSRS